ncbi:osmoprotectant transport system permease protein [Arthrobacter stackebrandtii]|uniref:Osmoprotectant transport system permease protein n=1 Tax=Arthrobacter stackebrandtii TaxID=272161 RepID=A0ABS4YUV0_9MICC|nr:ABC transporter permease [Arthrobacter stackebrandtii]MBP2412568.1 osmoprotectant transport system permease protein [Arthrobacter stackebrandtii]PYH02311.1 ABC transporter permease [Arthrobacter stackebrandtii]
MDWFLANLPQVLELTGYHLIQAVVPLALSMAIAIPLAQLARLNKTAGGIILSVGSLLYTIPSLALFVILPGILGTRILDFANIIVALTIYAVALLVRSTLDALNSVDDSIRQSATAMGYRPLKRFLQVDLPLSIPVLFAGLRVISVSNISLVTVGSLLGIPSLGFFFTDGLQRNFPTEIIVGIIGTLVLALLMDVVLVALQRLLTPWLRGGTAASVPASADAGAPAPPASPGTTAVLP